MRKVIYTTDTKYVPTSGWYYYDLQFEFLHGPFKTEMEAEEAHEAYIDKISYNRLMVMSII